MKQLQPVIWTKGTFLTPQHLQVQDRYAEDILKFRLQTLRFCPWGFKELAIDREMLAEGEFVVSRASGIFPDGLLFDIPDSDLPPPSKALAELFRRENPEEPEITSLDIYLTVPDYRPKGLNVSGSPDGHSRYLAESFTVRDENTGVGEKPLQIARKNFRLLGENETREGSSALRIANVERTEAGGYRLNERFIPPLIGIGASDYLVAMLRGLLEIMSAKSTQLSGARRQKNQSLADFTVADIANFWLLYTVNSHYPLFSHLCDEKSCHPEELYSTMLSLAGSLTTFSGKLRPRDLPLYVHDSLGTVFAQLDEALRSMLETVVPSNLVSLALKLVRTSVYATPIDRDKYLTDTRMYLAVSADAEEAVVIKTVPQLVKVCSATHIERLINRALPGIRLTHVPNPPAEIPMKLKYQYFALNQSGAAWETIKQARNFAAFVPADLPNPNLELLILMPRTE